MTLKDILSPEILFGKLTFQEDFLGYFNCDWETLFNNTKDANQKEKFKQLMNKHFYSVFRDNVGFHTFKDKILGFMLYLHYETMDRKNLQFKLSIDNFLLNLLFVVSDGSRFNSEYEASEDKVRFFKKNFIKIRDRFIDVKEKGNLSQYYNYVKKYISNYCPDRIKNKFLMIKNKGTNPGLFIKNPQMECLDEIINDFNNLISSIKILKTECIEDFNTTEFLELFDYDRLLLLLSYQLVSIINHRNIVNGDENPEFDSVVQLLFVYYDSVKKVRNSDQNYNPTFYDVKEKRNINLNDFIKKYQDFLKNYPTMELFRYSNTEELKKYLIKQGYKEDEVNNIDKFVYENSNVVLEFIDYLKAQRDLMAEWEFIPNGHGENGEEKNQFIASSFKNISETEIIRRRTIVNNYLENTPYLYRLIGRDKFIGYIGYLYPNGKVVFCQVIDKDKVVKSAALYVMNYKNFVYLSRKSKIEIIDIIRNNPTEDVQRVFHYEDISKTINQLDRIISGNNYDENVLEYIDSLISTKLLKKSGGRECN